jgi:hypothetical protein
MNVKSSGSQQNLVVYTTLSLLKLSLQLFLSPAKLQIYCGLEKNGSEEQITYYHIIFFFQIFLSKSASMWKTWRQHPPSHWTELKENNNGGLVCVCVCVCCCEIVH